MKVIALLAIRNEELFLARCLDHLASQGVRCWIIDNGSTDTTREIAERYRGACVDGVETYPYPGHYDWAGLLARKQALAETLDADWFIHHDADEIRQAPRAGQTLVDALAEVDAAGFNAVNFDEFVFLPATPDERHEDGDFVASMRRYFYFHPGPTNRVNAWKKSAGVDLVTSGGHNLTFEGRRLWPENFILRHYICLSQEHGRRKYERDHVYSEQEIRERGWHRRRADAAARGLRFPPSGRLKTLGRDDVFDRSDPQPVNILFQ